MNKRALQTLVVRFREFHTTQVELAERIELLNRPWEEDLLHWSWNGQQWRLHGFISPPADGRRRSVTKQGWCQACRAIRPPGNRRYPH